MVNNDIEKNILLNYDVFLIEQLIIFEEIKNGVDKKIKNYKNNYTAYYSNNLDEKNKIAYEEALEEIAEIKKGLEQLSELLEIFGMLTQRMVLEDLEILDLFKIENKDLKELKNNIENSGNASKPLKENYKTEYETSFLMVFGKIIFAIIIFVIAYIQIKNRKKMNFMRK
jgi:hypothetical protein